MLETYRKPELRASRTYARVVSRTPPRRLRRRRRPARRPLAARRRAVGQRHAGSCHGPTGRCRSTPTPRRARCWPRRSASCSATPSGCARTARGQLREHRHHHDPARPLPRAYRAHRRRAAPGRRDPGPPDRRRRRRPRRRRPRRLRRQRGLPLLPVRWRGLHPLRQGRHRAPAHARPTATRTGPPTTSRRSTRRWPRVLAYEHTTLGYRLPMPDSGGSADNPDTKIDVYLANLGAARPLRLLRTRRRLHRPSGPGLLRARQRLRDQRVRQRRTTSTRCG